MVLQIFLAQGSPIHQDLDSRQVTGTTWGGAFDTALLYLRL